MEALGWCLKAITLDLVSRTDTWWCSYKYFVGLFLFPSCLVRHRDRFSAGTATGCTESPSSICIYTVDFHPLRLRILLFMIGSSCGLTDNFIEYVYHGWLWKNSCAGTWSGNWYQITKFWHYPSGIIPYGCQVPLCPTQNTSLVLSLFHVGLL